MAIQVVKGFMEVFQQLLENLFTKDLEARIITIIAVIIICRSIAIRVYYIKARITYSIAAEYLEFIELFAITKLVIIIK